MCNFWNVTCVWAYLAMTGFNLVFVGWYAIPAVYSAMSGCMCLFVIAALACFVLDSITRTIKAWLKLL